jgi:hypothetical protein
MNKWMVFTNFENGNRGFAYFDDEDEARESMEEDLLHYKKHGVAVELGIAEIVESVTLNWDE